MSNGAGIRTRRGEKRKGNSKMIEKLIAENRKKLLLQLFAEGDGDGDGNGGGSEGEGGSGDGGDGNQGGNEPVSFDDFLKGEGNQAEFDRRVQKAINTAVAKAQEKWQALTDDKLSEAEKLAKMNKEEKALYKAQQAQKELEALKAQMAKTELEKEARKTLADAGINAPDALVSGLIREDAEKTNEAVKGFTELFNKTVNEAVKAKARQQTPPEGGGQSGGSKPSLAEMAKKARII